MAELDTQIKLADWIKRKLGYPSIQLEIEDASILQNIDDAIQLFSRHSAETKYENAFVLNLVAGQSLYDVDPSVISVVDFDKSQSEGTGMTRLFTVENTLMNEGYVNLKLDSGMVSWQLAQNYLEQFKDLMMPEFFVDYDKFNRKVKITPEPTRSGLVGILMVYSEWDREVENSIYNEFWIKNYALALTKITLGQIWGKFNGLALPGGGTLNGDGLKSEGIEEKKALEDDIIAQESEPYGFFVG
jgi:hypothetical protein